MTVKRRNTTMTYTMICKQHRHEEKRFWFYQERRFVIAQFGIPCVGLGSAAQYRKLTEYLRLNPDCAKGTFFLICLDDDRTGKERAKDLSNLLIEEGYRCARFNGISAPFKDPNERLQMDLEGLGQALKRAWDECQKLRLRRETA